MTTSVSICVLTYGDHAGLAQRAISSIRRHCPRSQYQLIVGANAPGRETLAYLKDLEKSGDVDHLVASPVNLNKCPMMRQMFDRVNTEFIWWFDDDSYLLNDRGFIDWLEAARNAAPSTVMWGQTAQCDHPHNFTYLDNALGFVRSATWYRGLPPPSWRPGGKGEFDFEGTGRGDGRWFFVLGGCWLIRTAAVRALDWPDKRLEKMGDDVFLGEAIRQQGWKIAYVPCDGVAIDAEARRGEIG